MLKRLSPLAIALLLCLPLLLFLAPFPQSPDGAEMCEVARSGGVLHPSGMPLQAWANHALMSLWPGDAGHCLPLSLFSWVGLLVASVFLVLLNRNLGVGLLPQILILAAFIYLPIVNQMSVIPEKYSWMMASSLMFLWALQRFFDKNNALSFLVLALSFSVALAHHSAAAVLLPALLGASLFFVMEPQSRSIKGFVVRGVEIFLIGIGSMALVALAYVSLLWLRSQNGWPDWGGLESLEDVFWHFARRDYDFTSLHHSEYANLNSLNAYAPIWESVKLLNLFVIFVFLGFPKIWNTKVRFGLCMTASLVATLSLLGMTSMPLVSFNTVWAYLERYQLLLWPLMFPVMAVGLQTLFDRFPQKQARVWIIVPLCFSLLYLVASSFVNLRGIDTELVEIYREEAARELPSQSIFMTMSDFVAFAGVPERTGIRFPLKSMFSFPWYRDVSAPAIEPRLKKLLREFNGRPFSMLELVRLAIRHGLTVSTTEATAFLRSPDIMSIAEQRGVLWVFRTRNRGLYTDEILQTSQRLCGRLSALPAGLPREGQYFAREFLESFRYSFMGAADHLENIGQSPASMAARQIAEKMLPGVSPREWSVACDDYFKTLGVR